jgi:subtilisin family serine protease/Mg-chelatase subunit ChlD
MSELYLLSSTPSDRTNAVVAREAHLIRAAGGRPFASLPHGTMAELTPAAIGRFAKAGYRVVRYDGVDRLGIAGRDIDIHEPTRGMRAEELVPLARAAKWPLHVVQLRGPAFPEWRKEVEAHAVDVVGRAGRYGLMVHGSPEAAAQLLQLEFVAMVSPLQPGWKLDARLGREVAGAGRVSLRVFPEAAVDEVIAAAEAIGGHVLAKERDRQAGVVRVVLGVDLGRALALAALPEVLGVQLVPVHELHGEREAQILAENLDVAAAPNTAPVVGYQNFLTTLGADGTGVTVAIADSGIDQGANNNATGHLDLRGRQVAYTRYTVPIPGGVNTPPATDTNGHGTHVAGIAVGNGATGTTEGAVPNNFLWGQGIAPGARYFGQAMQNAGGSGLYVPAIATLCADAVGNGASVQNNSWGSDGTAAYTQDEADFDAAVRDADAAAAALEPLTVVFSAGNAGGRASTIGEPGSAKNVITVGNGLTRRPGVGFPSDDIRGVSGTSSRGPAPGGRIKPDVIATGTDVSSTMSQSSGNTAIAGAATYTYKSGTSMAAPAVTGACAVLTDWWGDRTGGDAPSPALLKAMLISGAEDLVGGANWRRLVATSLNAANSTFSVAIGFVPTEVRANYVDTTGTTQIQLLTLTASTAGMPNQSWNVTAGTLTIRITGVQAGTVIWAFCLDAPLASAPNNDQGWGRVSLENIVYQAPASDRGPRLFLDQRHAFTANGQRHTWRIQPADTSRPMRATLVWTDAPGNAGDNTPLVNDLDLELTQTVGATTTTWRGNNFINGFTGAGGVADTGNNVEGIALQSPSGVYELSVVAGTLTEDARDAAAATPWQDYALVVENAVFAAADPVAVSVVVDRSGSMVWSGYVDATRSASRQFIDLMSADDEVGVVSFGTTATHEYHGGSGVVTITGAAEKTAAKAAIDGIAFDGCTYMGQGLELAQAQLAGTGNRRAVVLLSDGYDNKGCDAANPAKLWARDVAAAMPADIDVYTCAMGPASDQGTLADVAQLTGGRYYFMPTIDDLYEIYNFIRGNVTSTGVIVNTTSTASSSRVAAVVDCGAEQVQIACQWHAPGLKWTGGTPNKREIRVRLRTPQGRLLPADVAWVSRTVGDDHVVFTVEDPQPGRWQVEVETGGEGHARYTVGGWVRSGLQLGWELGAPGAGSVLARLGLTGDKQLRVSYTATLSAPTATPRDLLDRLRDRLANIKPDPVLVRTGVDPDLARLMAYDQDRVRAGASSLFAQKVTPVRVSPLAQPGGLEVPELVVPTHLRVPGLVRPVRRGDLGRAAVALRPSARLTHAVKLPAGLAGSYTLRVHALMVNAQTGCRFERVAAQSFVVGDRG